MGTGPERLELRINLEASRAERIPLDQPTNGERACNWPLLFNPAMLLKNYRDLAPLITLAEREQKKTVIPVVKIPE
ncbi:MAG TPA: hypothetical protein VKG25_22155 [Bryobacteraceae bacterium]|nr:hypothetical protein [Bryobacteraceae bacterium]